MNFAHLAAKFDEVASSMIQRIRIRTVAFAVTILRTVIMPVVTLIAVDSIADNVVVDYG